ncbi:MAG TPA: hypothetical protein VGG21_05130 [Acidimicrobiales bacterium]|jgi:hypothetical protein
MARGVMAVTLVVALSGLIVTDSARPAAASWPPCSSTVTTSCVPVYPAGGVAFAATLSGPSAITVSKANCPTGSLYEENAYACSAPVVFHFDIPNDRPGVYNIHINGASETDSNIVYSFADVTPSPQAYTGWCDVSKTTSSCVNGDSTSLPMYLVVPRPVKHDTMLLCGLGQYPYGDAFGGCIQVVVTLGKGRTKSTKPSSNLSVELAGARGSDPNTIGVTMTVSNDGASDIKGLNFADSTGIENDGVLLKNGNIGPTKSGLTLTSGPSPHLPTTLPAHGPPVVVHYTYTASSSGDAVLDVSATGTDGKGSVKSKAALTVYVTNPPATEADYDNLVTSALLAEDSESSEGQNTIATSEANSLAKYLKLPAASPGQQYAAVTMGLPTQMGVLVGSTKDNAFSQWMGTYYTTLASDLKGGASYLGQTGQALATQLVETATDPQARAAVLGRVWDGIQALPAQTKAALASQSDNLGYAGQALAASLTPDGQVTGVIDSAAAGATSLKALAKNVGYAATGFSTMIASDNAAYAKNPTAFINAESKQYADATYGLIKTEVLTVVGDGIFKGVGAAAKAGYSALSGEAASVDSTVAGSISSTAPPATGSTAALMQNANAATSQFQTLPIGDPLAPDQLTQLAGMVPGDQVGFQKALQYINDKYGVPLEVGARTSEPLSVGIDGSPKLSFMKPKAVSAMDMMMGAPSEIAAYNAPGEAASAEVFKGGVTTVFKPTAIPDDVLAAIGQTNPDFVTQYQARYASQMKLWTGYQDETSTLRVLVKGSAENDGGVTAIASVPGYPVPPPAAGGQPLVYLQQLDDPAFVRQFGLTAERAQSLKASLANSPGAVQVDYIARTNPPAVPGGEPSISFFDGLQNNRPFVSDQDLQYIQPADGAPWPSGLQSKIQLDFQNQLQKNLTRLPDHGASGTAFDLPASNIGVADAFVLGTTNPAFAQAVATNLATRYASQSAIFSSNAARLTSLAAVTSDPVEVKALLTQARIYRDTAATFSKVDAAYLLAKYPPGEKIIIIKLGDVRVGFGP